MGPPTVAQRVDLIEEKLHDMETSLKEMVMTTVEKAIEAMRHSLTEVLLEGQTLATQKMGTEFETLATRLDGRVNRSREFHETLINTIRNDQLKFQTEIRSSLTGLHSIPNSGTEKGEGSVFRSDSLFAHPESGIGGLGAKSVVMGVDRVFAGSGQGPGPGNWRYRKLDMPIFDGTDPDGWIMRVERYFSFYRLIEEEMLEAVVVAMEGDALRWYQWEHKRHPVRRWTDLKGFILRQFRAVNGGSLYEQWLSTTQVTSVTDYRRKFIETAGPLERVSEG